MTDTTTHTDPTIPAWLAEAEHEHKQQQNLGALMDRERASLHAKKINDRLARLGITPEKRALTSQLGHLVPAVIISPDRERGYHGVSATFRDDCDGGDVVLLVADWEDPADVRQGHILHSISDVARARRNLPAVPRPPKLDPRSEAMSALGYRGSEYTSADADQICHQLAGLTAAVLHLADVTTRANTRP